MATYIVRYHYGASAEEISGLRPMHREWLKGQLESGNLLASGPLTDLPQALLIWRADDQVRLGEVLDQDPFDVAGFIAEREVAEWNPVLGPFA